MPREKAFLGVLLVLVLGGVVVGIFDRDHLEPVEYSLAKDLPAPSPQPSRERIWAEVVLEELTSLTSLEQPLNGAFDAENRLLIQDWPTRSVHEFSEDGRLVERYAVFEPDVDEPYVLQHFTVGPDDRLWLASQELTFVEAIQREGGATTRFELSAPPLQLTPVRDGLLVLRKDPSGPLFELYHLSGRPPLRFGRLVADLEVEVIVDGELAGDGGDTFVYAPRYFSQLASYTTEGDLRFLVETIQPDPPPRVVTDGARQQLAAGTPSRTLGVDVDRAWIYVLSQREKGRFGPRILDVYSRDDGAYLHSFRLPGNPIDVRIRGNRLLMVENEQVRLFRAQPAFGSW